ncbi:hypothetical protein [Streptomyces sp. NPDC001948]
MVDGWLAQALADCSGRYADPADAHTAADGELEFAAYLAQTDLAATNALAAWLDRGLAPTELAEAGVGEDGAW